MSMIWRSRRLSAWGALIGAAPAYFLASAKILAVALRVVNSFLCRAELYSAADGVRLTVETLRRRTFFDFCGVRRRGRMMRINPRPRRLCSPSSHLLHLLHLRYIGTGSDEVTPAWLAHRESRLSRINLRKRLS